MKRIIIVIAGSCSLPADAGRRGAGDRALRGDQHDAQADQPRPVPPDIG